MLPSTSTEAVQWLCAPMEGVTGAPFRRVHRKCFGGISQYYIPFLSPTRDRVWTKKDMRELLPDGKREEDTVPQLLTREAGDFLWAAEELAEMGFDEVNLNLGCPSGTVTAKRKGSGMLMDLEALERFLDRIFEASPISISLKTRLGMKNPEEFEPIMDLFCQYPVRRLTIHPRVREDFYKGSVRMEAFDKAVNRCELPVCYNGDLFTADDCTEFCRKYPMVHSVMLGRGLAGNPALAREVSGGAVPTTDELQNFLGELFESYAVTFQNPHAAMLRMKELWSYLIGLFDGVDRLCKNLRKSKTVSEYQSWELAILREGELRRDNRGGF